MMAIRMKSRLRGSPDLRWIKRVQHRLKRFWATEASQRSPGVAEKFALATIATHSVFTEAVDNISSYVVPDSYGLNHYLDASNHPDDHGNLIMIERERIKRETIRQRRLLHREAAA